MEVKKVFSCQQMPDRLMKEFINLITKGGNHVYIGWWVKPTNEAELELQRVFASLDEDEDEWSDGRCGE